MRRLSLTPLSTRPVPEMSQSREQSSVNIPTILVMVSNLSQNMSSVLKNSQLARLLLLKPMLPPLLLVLVHKLVVVVSSVDSL